MYSIKLTGGCQFSISSTEIKTFSSSIKKKVYQSTFDDKNKHPLQVDYLKIAEIITFPLDLILKYCLINETALLSP